jgi:uncharacterized protein YdaU (DUF1376 family)
MHYFQFNIGDYRAATAHLSNEEDLAYRRLLDMYYDTEQKIPLDTQWVARRLRVGTEVVEAVLADMFEKQEDGWFHARCEEIIKQYKEFAEAGKRGAAKRWGNKGVTPPNGEASSPHTPPPMLTINQELITTNDIKEAKASPDLGKPKSAPACPVAEIVEMYNTMLPMLPAVSVVNDSRKRAIAARWREVVTTEKMDRQQGLEFFQWFFKMVKDSKFLTGKAKDWKADIDFLFNASKFPRIVEGTYHEDKK